MEMIPKKDAPLYIDVVCHDCGKRVALSNARVTDGRYYCYPCDVRLNGTLEQQLARTEKTFAVEGWSEDIPHQDRSREKAGKG